MQYPLSPVQQGMLFHRVQSGRDTGVDIEQLVAHLARTIDVDALGAAWAARRRPAPDPADAVPLGGTRRAAAGGRSASVDVPLDVSDLSALTAAEQDAHARRVPRDDRRRGFDLARRRCGA